jgi:hypothetical protein
VAARFNVGNMSHDGLSPIQRLERTSCSTWDGSLQHWFSDPAFGPPALSEAMDIFNRDFRGAQPPWEDLMREYSTATTGSSSQPPPPNPDWEKIWSEGPGSVQVCVWPDQDLRLEAEEDGETASLWDLSKDELILRLVDSRTRHRETRKSLMPYFWYALWDLTVAKQREDYLCAAIELHRGEGHRCPDATYQALAPQHVMEYIAASKFVPHRLLLGTLAKMSTAHCKRLEALLGDHHSGACRFLKSKHVLPTAVDIEVPEDKAFMFELDDAKKGGENSMTTTATTVTKTTKTTTALCYPSMCLSGINAGIKRDRNFMSCHFRGREDINYMDVQSTAALLSPQTKKLYKDLIRKLRRVEIKADVCYVARGRDGKVILEPAEGETEAVAADRDPEPSSSLPPHQTNDPPRKTHQNQTKLVKNNNRQTNPSRARRSPDKQWKDHRKHCKHNKFQSFQEGEGGRTLHVPAPGAREASPQAERGGLCRAWEPQGKGGWWRQPQQKLECFSH